LWAKKVKVYLEWEAKVDQFFKTIKYMDLQDFPWLLKVFKIMPSLSGNKGNMMLELVTYQKI